MRYWFARISWFFWELGTTESPLRRQLRQGFSDGIAENERTR